MKRLLPWLLVVLAAPPAPAPAVAQTAPSYAAADVRFISGMIPHHAQALLIAGWAPTHGASPAVRTLAARIIASQTDEIALLSRWLDERHQPVPHIDPAHMMHDMDSTHMMPGMLTPEQLAQLDGARGRDWDHLFLRLMIQHHRGAITMVDELFAAGGGEENSVYKIATDIFADQTTEIERMQRMLAADFIPQSTPR